MAEIGSDIDEDLQLLDIKVKQLKNEYEGYFIGNRPREPRVLRGEVQKIVALYSNLHIKNTGHRFKFNNLRARFFSFKRHWDLTVRKIEEGRYERDVFKANLRDRSRGLEKGPGKRTQDENGVALASGDRDLFDAYVSARQACGQNAKGITPDKLRATLAKQEAAIRAKYDCKSVKFRVVVEEGKARLKAAPIRS